MGTMSKGRSLCSDMKFYFAYGSNMWVEQMQSRCPNHQLVGRGVLKGYRWIISSRGYANIVKSPQSEVMGTVYEISEPDERCLDRHEGVASGSYMKIILNIECNGSNLDCLTYIDPIEDEGKPKHEYIGRINKGIEDANLPYDYVQNSIRRFVPK